jgi:cytochrome b561
LIASTYDTNTIRYHWASAALIVAIWIVGQSAGFVADGPLRNAVWSTHFTLGGVLAAVWIGGLLWRSSGGRQLPGLGSKSTVGLTAWIHGLLYVGVGAVIGLGVLAACARGAVIWGFFTYPKLIGDDMTVPFTAAHALAANLLLGLALAHTLFVLARHFVLRDGVLARMWPGLARRV